MIVAAVPVKDLINAKQRLVPALGAAERAALAAAMLQDVLAALAAARLDRVWVVTREPAVLALARARGAEPLAEDANRGHTAAVARAQAEATRLGARVFLTVPGDVPCVTADEIRRLAEAAAPGAPAFVPSRSGLGTNGAALAPPDAMPLTFGEPSLPGLGLDVDAPDDLAALLAAPGTTVSVRLVASWRAGGRLRAAGVPR